MTEAQFRTEALKLPSSEERSHMNHPDFRVQGKVFGTLGYPRPGFGVLKLTPEQQQQAIVEFGDVFAPAAGAWGARGMTTIELQRARLPVVRSLMLLAWRNVAPKTLLAEIDSN